MLSLPEEAPGPEDGMIMSRIPFHEIKPGMTIFRREGRSGRWRRMGTVANRDETGIVMESGREMRSKDWGGGRALWWALPRMV